MCSTTKINSNKTAICEPTHALKTRAALALKTIPKKEILEGGYFVAILESWLRSRKIEPLTKTNLRWRSSEDHVNKSLECTIWHALLLMALFHGVEYF